MTDALQKLNELKTKYGKHRPHEKRPRHYAEEITHLPQEKWEQAISEAPRDFHALIREHLESFKLQTEGFIRAHADRIMEMQGYEGAKADRRAQLDRLAEPLRTKVEEEVRRRFLTKTNAVFSGATRKP